MSWSKITSVKFGNGKKVKLSCMCALPSRTASRVRMRILKKNPRIQVKPKIEAYVSQLRTNGNSNHFTRLFKVLFEKQNSIISSQFQN